MDTFVNWVSIFESRMETPLTTQWKAYDIDNFMIRNDT